MSGQDQHETRWHSRHGGMWIDRLDFEEEIARRLSLGRLPASVEVPTRQLQRDGYAILRNAVSPADLDRFAHDISRSFREGNDELVVQEPADPTPRRIVPGSSPRGLRVVDCFAAMPSALDLFASPRLTELLRAVFDETPMLFQSLSFDMGSEQGLHQDTAYVVVDERPMELLACWIALEDVHPDSGPLVYLRGSHRLGDFDFNGRKHWNPELDGPDLHHAWFQWIEAGGERQGLEREVFLARRGDILVWHADLAHGGSPIIDATRTRRSLVGHFCPVSASPHFMSYLPDHRHRARHGTLAYCSGHYLLLSDAEAVAQGPAGSAEPSRRQGLIDRIISRVRGGA